jgi:hypothetical protein
MRASIFASGVVVLGLSVSAPLVAQDDPGNAPPPVFQAVVDCRGIPDSAARLVCYDEAVGELSDAQAEKRVVIADREQIREARRGLFGLALPDLKLFSSDGEKQITEIETTIKSARRNEAGKWLFVLEDGARWAQTDTRPIYPDPGDPIRIRSAAMGSFMANVDGAVAIRVRRIN